MAKPSVGGIVGSAHGWQASPIGPGYPGSSPQEEKEGIGGGGGGPQITYCSFKVICIMLPSIFTGN
jgi:hypothetical protein